MRQKEENVLSTTKIRVLRWMQGAKLREHSKTGEYDRQRLPYIMRWKLRVVWACEKERSVRLERPIVRPLLRFMDTIRRDIPVCQRKRMEWRKENYRIVGKWRRPIQKATRRAHVQQKPEMEVLDSLYVNEDATIN